MSSVKHKSIKHMLISLFAVAVLIGLDQLTKYLAYMNLRVNGPITLIKGVFSFTWTENIGAAWGILGGSVILDWLPIIIAVVVALAYWIIPVNKRMLPLNIVMLFFFAGAVGNRIDRSVYGGVQDFLYFELIDFPIFNVADCYIVLSSITAAFLFLFYYKDEKELADIFSFRKDKKDEGNNI